MSGIGAALQGAINGFVGGVNTRHAWDDRKDQKARQKRADGIMEAREVRAQQSHDMDLKTSDLMNQSRGQQIRATEQLWDDFTGLRGAQDAAVEAADAGLSQGAGAVSTKGGASLGAVPGMDTQAAATRQPEAENPLLDSARSVLSSPSPAATGQQRGMGYGAAIGAGQDSVQAAPAPTSQPALGAAPDLVSRAEQLTAQHFNDPAYIGVFDRPAPAGNPVDLFRIRPDGTMIANRLPQNDAEKRALLEAGKAGRLGITDERAARQAQIDRQTELDLPYSWGEAGATRRDVQRASDIADRAVLGAVKAGVGSIAETAINEGVDLVQGINRPLQAASRWITGKDHIGAPGRVDLTGDGVKQSLATPLATGWGAIRADEAEAAPQPALKQWELDEAGNPINLRVNGKPVEAPAAGTSATAQETSDAAARAMNALGDSPGMKAAADAIPAAAMGATKTAPLTDKERDEAADTWEASYRKNGAPMVRREMLRQGMISEAKAFGEFIDSGQAKDGLRSWSRGVFAAMQGDIDSAADNLIEAYNSAGYFDDGYEIVRDQSKLIRDNSGEVVGLTLAMKNQQTGEIVENTDSIEGFIEKAIWLTSPEKAFEAVNARNQAAQKAMIEADERRQSMAADLIKTNYSKTVDLAKSIMEQSTKDAEAAQFSGDQVERMTWDEAFAEAQRLMGGGGPQASAPVEDVPVARRAG